MAFSFNQNIGYNALNSNLFSNFSMSSIAPSTMFYSPMSMDLSSMFSNMSLLNTSNFGYGMTGQNLFTGFNSFPTFSQYPINSNISFGGLTSLSSNNTVTTSSSTRTTVPTTTFKFTTKGSKKVVSNMATNPNVQKALDIARSQVGVKEDGSSNNSYNVNKYRGGVANGQPWCASFVSYCFGNAQGSNKKSPFGYTASSQRIKNEAIKAGKYSDKNDNYKPQVGDLAIWTYQKNVSGHVGIISAINEDGTFEVIEGNCDNSVKQCTRSFDTKDLAGFVKMNEWVQQA